MPRSALIRKEDPRCLTDSRVAMSPSENVGETDVRLQSIDFLRRHAPLGTPGAITTPFVARMAKYSKLTSSCGCSQSRDRSARKNVDR
jgi:hypothetical protein